VHVFLGHPAGDLCDITTVEPGNAYSPGMWTCGISVGLVMGEAVFLADRIPDQELEWGFERDRAFCPVLKATYQAGPVKVEHELSHLGTEGSEGVDFNRIVLSSTQPADGTLLIVVRELGPAGGEIADISWFEDKQILQVNKNLQLTIETPKFTCSMDKSTEKIAILSTPFSIRSTGTLCVTFKTEHGFDNRWFTPSIPKMLPFQGVSVDQGMEKVCHQWGDDLPARVFSPDPRLEQVWQTSAFHILNAMDTNLARIGAANYPIFWLRDGVIILRALDLMGRHDLARYGCDYISPLIFCGGFGAESDAPGEGIWTLVSHARLLQDDPWLREIFPTIKKRVDWLQRMIGATKTIRYVTENRTASTYNTPASSIVCLPAVDGVIHGRMDGHSPDFYINCWALVGLRQAAWAAQKLGEPEHTAWSAEADRLEAAMAKVLLPQYGNERDPVVSPYPCGALTGAEHIEGLKRQFIAWYRVNRLDANGKRKPEQLWTYFEAAQIHNAFLLGFKDEAWVCLDGMLDGATSPWNISAWVEGPPGGGEQLPFGNNVSGKGWLRKEKSIAGNMPHNWTSGEVINMIRDIYVIEENGRLVLGKGVPTAWLVPGSRFGVSQMPTDLGMVSYTVDVGADGVACLDYHGPENYSIAW
jgi:hypothetical protein